MNENTKKAKKKEKPQKQPEVAMRCSSVSGIELPVTDPRWKNYKPFWVIEGIDEDTFLGNHSESEITGLWFNPSTVNLGSMEQAEGFKQMYNPLKELQEDSRFACCGISGRWGYAENTVSVFTDKYGHKSELQVSVKSAQDHCALCDVTKQLFRKSDLAYVFESSGGKYKFVCKSKLMEIGYSKCGNCSKYHPIDDLIYNSQHDAKICPQCTSHHKLKNTIGQHDWKPNKFNFFNSPQFRMGHTEMNGAIVATNQREQVKDNRLFGVELEMEFDKAFLVKKGKIRHNVAQELKNILGEFIFIKEDGTLTMNGKYSGDGKFDPDGTKNGILYAGFEVVSHPADLGFHRSMWPKLEKSEYYKAMRAWDTETCGMHVHVNKKSLTMLQLGRMLEFVNHSNTRKFVQKVAGRSYQKYTRYLDKRVTDSLHPERVISPDESSGHNRARRVALNVANEHTVEFRIFRGTVNPRHIIRNLEFCDAICTFCMPAARSLKEFSDPVHFIEFISSNRKRWPLLAEWMAKWELIKIKSWGPKADVPKLTLKPHDTEEHEDKCSPPPLEEETPVPVLNTTTINASDNWTISGSPVGTWAYAGPITASDGLMPSPAQVKKKKPAIAQIVAEASDPDGDWDPDPAPATDDED